MLPPTCIVCRQAGKPPILHTNGRALEKTLKDSLLVRITKIFVAELNTFTKNVNTVLIRSMRDYEAKVLSFLKSGVFSLTNVVLILRLR